MKARLRIPTEMYAYIEVEVEQKEESIDRIIQSYFSVKDAFERESKARLGQGLSAKEFNAFLDKYLNDGEGNLEVYQAMSPAQKQTIQDIKRAFNRINRGKHDE